MGKEERPRPWFNYEAFPEGPTEEFYEYYDEILEGLQNASSSINCSFADIRDWNVTELVYMGQEPPADIYHLSATDWLKIGVYACLSVCGLVGNLAVIVLVLRSGPLRTTINYYLINLAVADLIISIFCIWIHLVDNVSRAPWVMGSFVCKISGFLQMTALTSSTMTLTVISADRFLAVIFPLKVRAMQQHCVRVITWVWLLAIVVSLPFLVFREMVTLQWKTYEENICIDTWPQVLRYNENGTCYMDHFWKRFYYTAVSSALFFLPFGIMGINYTLIGAKMWRSEIPGISESSSLADRAANNHRLGTKYKVLKMVVVVMLVFCLCWTPLQFVNLYAMWAHDVYTDGQLSGWFDSATFVAYTCAYANSALNPILYGGLNSALRKSISQLFGCWWHLCHRGRPGRQDGLRRQPAFKVYLRQRIEQREMEIVRNRGTVGAENGLEMGAINAENDLSTSAPNSFPSPGFKIRTRATSVASHRVSNLHTA